MSECRKCEKRNLKRQLLRKLRALWPAIAGGLSAVRYHTTDHWRDPKPIILGDEVDEQVRQGCVAKAEIEALLSRLGAMED